MEKTKLTIMFGKSKLILLLMVLLSLLINLHIATASVCGDGLKNSFEECELPRTTPSTDCLSATCSADCSCVPRECGDGVLELNGPDGNPGTPDDEQCDDGNKVSGDGCSTDCIIEFNVCGDGVIGGIEQCEYPGALEDPDCAGATCGLDCSCKIPTCGNEILEPKGNDATAGTADDEQCDDGDNVDGDGCSFDCKIEPSAALCGDGVVTAPVEECELPQTAPNTDCLSATCTSECTCVTRECGDGLREPDGPDGNPGTPDDEQCDDGNKVSGDGCSDFCELETVNHNTLPAVINTPGHHKINNPDSGTGTTVTVSDATVDFGENTYTLTGPGTTVVSVAGTAAQPLSGITIIGADIKGSDASEVGFSFNYVDDVYLIGNNIELTGDDSVGMNWDNSEGVSVGNVITTTQSSSAIVMAASDLRSENDVFVSSEVGSDPAKGFVIVTSSSADFLGTDLIVDQPLQESLIVTDPLAHVSAEDWAIAMEASSVIPIWDLAGSATIAGFEFGLPGHGLGDPVQGLLETAASADVEVKNFDVIYGGLAGSLLSNDGALNVQGAQSIDAPVVSETASGVQVTNTQAFLDNFDGLQELILRTKEGTETTVTQNGQSVVVFIDDKGDLDDTIVLPPALSSEITSQPDTSGFDYEVTVSPKKRIVEAGTSTFADVIATSKDGTNVPLLTFETAHPQGVTVEFSAPDLNQCAPGTTSCDVRMEVKTDLSTKPGRYGILVGTASPKNRDTLYELIVDYDYDLKLETSEIQIAREQTTPVPVEVSITDGGGVSAVTLEAKSRSEHIVVEFVPKDPTCFGLPCKRILKVKATSKARLGIHKVDIKTTSPIEKTVTLNVEVVELNYELIIDTSNHRVAKGGTITVPEVRTKYISGLPIPNVILSPVQVIPKGIEITFNPKTCIPGTNHCDVEMIVTATSEADAGTYTLRMGSLTEPGFGRADADFTFTVTEPSAVQSSFSEVIVKGSSLEISDVVAGQGKAGMLPLFGTLFDLTDVDVRLGLNAEGVVTKGGTAAKPNRIEAGRFQFDLLGETPPSPPVTLIAISQFDRFEGTDVTVQQGTGSQKVGAATFYGATIAGLSVDSGDVAITTPTATTTSLVRDPASPVGSEAGRFTVPFQNDIIYAADIDGVPFPVQAGCSTVDFLPGDTEVTFTATPTDADDDGVPDEVDNCPPLVGAEACERPEPSLGGPPTVCSNGAQFDSDVDQIGDACDSRPGIPGTEGPPGTSALIASTGITSVELVDGDTTIKVELDAATSGAPPGSQIVIQSLNPGEASESLSVSSGAISLVNWLVIVIDSVGNVISDVVQGTTTITYPSDANPEDIEVNKESSTGTELLGSQSLSIAEATLQTSILSLYSEFALGIQGCNQGNITLTSTLNASDTFVFEGEDIFSYSLEEARLGGINPVEISAAPGMEIFDGSCAQGIQDSFTSSFRTMVPQTQNPRLICVREIGTRNMFELQNTLFGPGEDSRDMTFRAIGVQRFCDSDGDGVSEDVDQCRDSVGPATQAGCPFADRTIASLQIIDREKSGVCGFKANGKAIPTCKEPLADLPVKVFDREDPDFVTAFGTSQPDKQFLDDIYEADIGLLGECTTDLAGECIVGEETPGKFLVVGKFNDTATSTTVYTGKFKDFFDDDNDGPDDDEEDDEDDDNCDDDNDGDCDDDDILKTLIKKKLKVLKIINKDGSVKYKAGYSTIVQGSRLEVLHLEYEVWEDNNETYPFAFTSNETWDVNVCTSIPTGYQLIGVEDDNGTLISTSNCTQTLVQNETKLLFFDLLETSSPEPNMGFTFTVSHEGETQTIETPIQGVRSWTEEQTEAEVDARVKEVKAKLQAAVVSQAPTTRQAPPEQPEASQVLAGQESEDVSGTLSPQEGLFTDVLIAVALIGVMALVILLMNRRDQK